MVLCVPGVCRHGEKVVGQFAFLLCGAQQREPPAPSRYLPCKSIFALIINSSIHCHLYPETPFDAASPSLV